MNFARREDVPFRSAIDGLRLYPAWDLLMHSEFLHIIFDANDLKMNEVRSWMDDRRSANSRPSYGDIIKELWRGERYLRLHELTA